MAKGTPRAVVLSIHPVHATAILEGRKRVEFRKRSFSPDTAVVILYATAPTSRIVGLFSIGAVVADSPTVIWEKYKEFGAISRRYFRGYYAGSRTAVAIVIDRVIPLDQPLSLSSLRHGVTPPQSFTYVPVNKAIKAMGRRGGELDSVAAVTGVRAS